jgi:hypothetical protein
MYLTESSAIELNIAIVCASLLFVKPLLRSTFPGILSGGVSSGVGSGTRSEMPWCPGVLTQTEIELKESNGKTTQVSGHSALVSESQEEIIFHT